MPLVERSMLHCIGLHWYSIALRPDNIQIPLEQMRKMDTNRINDKFTSFCLVHIIFLLFGWLCLAVSQQPISTMAIHAIHQWIVKCSTQTQLETFVFLISYTWDTCWQVNASGTFCIVLQCPFFRSSFFHRMCTCVCALF